MELYIDGLFGFGASFKLDGFRIIFCSLIIIMWIIAMEFSKDYLKKGYADEINGKEDGGASGFVFFSLIVFVASIGMVLANDMITAFIFFESMSLASYPWVTHFGTAKDMRAAASYLTYAVIGGLVTLTGIIMLVNKLNCADYDTLYEMGAYMSREDKLEVFLPCLLIIFGYAAKAGMYPLHTWLAPSYVAAPAPAAALLSAVLSKLGIIGMTVVTAGVMSGLFEWGMMLLILGLVTMLVGGLWAMLSIDMKRIVSYSSMSQIGYIIVALGVSCILGGAEDVAEFAPRGAFLHMINHSVYKMIFFVVIGIIAMDCGRNLDINKIKGWGYNKIYLKAVCTIAALGISGVPLLSGYVSKTFIHEGLSEYVRLVRNGLIAGSVSVSFVKTLEIIFLVASGFTFAYMLKILIPVFWCKPENEAGAEGRGLSGSKIKAYILLAFPTAFAVVCGVMPGYTLERLGNMGAKFFAASQFNEAPAYFSWSCLKGTVISIVIGIILYLALAKNVRKNIFLAWFSLEESLYKPVLFKILPAICTFFMRICDWCIEGPVYLIRRTVLKNNSIEPKPHRKNAKLHEFMATGNLFAKSVSFGLIMFAIAFLVTMIYMLLMLIK